MSRRNYQSLCYWEAQCGAAVMSSSAQGQSLLFLFTDTGIFCCVPGKAPCPADCSVHWVCHCPLTRASGRLLFRWNWLELVLRQEHVFLWAHRLCIHCVLQVCAFVVYRPSAFQSVCAACVWGFSHLHHPQYCDHTAPGQSVPCWDGRRSKGSCSKALRFCKARDFPLLSLLPQHLVYSLLHS